MLVDIESTRGNRLKVAASPLKLSRTGAAIQGGPPSIGEHTREVLRSLLGLSSEETEAEFSRGATAEGRDLPPELTGS